jgi:hypothetical protein
VKGRDLLGDLGIEGWKILKLILNRCQGVDWIQLARRGFSGGM